MSDTLKIFFVTDLHGSEKCFSKFLNAGKFYNTHVLIMGGDITGKLMIPIVKQNEGSFEATYADAKHVAKNEQELETLEKEIRFEGYYPYLTTPSEMEELQNKPEMVESVFKKLMLDNVQRWVDLTEKHLKGSGISVYITGGNDDLREITPILQSSDFVIDPEEKVVSLDSKHEMLSTGWSNPTPWKTPREVSEEELGKMMDEMAFQVKSFKNCIFNTHVPPIDSGLDTAPKLDANLKPVVEGGEMAVIPAGSTAIRAAIEKYQPLLGLHGHIHESKGFVNIGRTLCINPGSEYSEGILRGVIVELGDGKVKNFLLTQG